MINVVFFDVERACDDKKQSFVKDRIKCIDTSVDGVNTMRRLEMMALYLLIWMHVMFIIMLLVLICAMKT